MSYKGFRDQLLGEEPLLDGEYFSYEGQKRERHKSDRLAVQQVQSWLRDPSFLSEPYFVLIQLDGTHYTYYFDEDSVIRRPYAEGIHPTQLKEADITLIHNRYLNSARAVDDRVGELLETIRASGSYDDTVIVVASDHGEGFKKGQFGHWTLDETIQHVPLLMKLPTVEPRRVKSLVSHRHIFPTLFDYLGIRSEGQESLGLRGKSLLPEWKGDGAVLTFDFRLKNADLTTPMFVARFAVARSETAMTFSPVAVYDRAGNRLQSALENTQWRKWIRQMGAR
jgi:arylsulfatase A-like enzyme